MDIQDTNRAAELEQYLKSRINSIPYRDLIKEIRVDEGDSESSLKVMYPRTTSSAGASRD